MTARVPVAAARIGRDEVVVICDDGAVFMGDGGRWNECYPIPGSEVDLIQKRDAFLDRMSKRFGPPGDWAEFVRRLHVERKGDLAEAIVVLRSLIEEGSEVESSAWHSTLTLTRDELRKGWPEFVNPAKKAGRT